MRRAGASDRRGIRVAGSMSPDQQLAQLIASLSGWWWDKRTGITIATGVSAWVDRVQGATLSQATGTKQPTYNASTGLTFDGVDDFLLGAANSLQGKPGYTAWVCGSLTVVTGYMWTYNNSDAALYSVGSNLRAFMQAGAPFNEWSSGLTSPYPRAVYAAQGQWADGTTAQKILYKDGATAGGSRTTAGDVSAGSFAAASMSVGATAAGASPSPLVCQHVIAAPSQVSAAVIAQVSALLHTVEGF